jgi:type III restriction enzyme
MTHPVIPFDEATLAEVAARLDLRTPNSEALAAVARALDTSGGEPVDVVCDLATAVGKTYLAAGLIDYVAEAGVRHVLFVTPGRTILDKTVANFTEGHRRSVVGGLAHRPLVITAENFNTGATGAALDDPDQLKLFVFNVQQLIRPSDKVTRRTRKHQEWLGADLYQYLRDADDLVVVADECHVYTEKAKAFHDAVRDLDALATVGLTATPSSADSGKVVYRYPLARAIADRYVKTPVLVGRQDDAGDVETRLRDGLTLLDAKAKAAAAYSTTTGVPTVNPVMFVVADTIDNANAVAETLRKPGLLNGDYESQVLVVHSDAPDDALARLAAVEEPDSPVRVIVSVSMLKEGWDVKNIYVICSLRPSISDVLTEQTLGRGLRLPWGAYTGVELLDTVEVVSHERYKELLQRADVLLEGLVDSRPAGPAPAAAESVATGGGEAAAEGVTATPAGPGPDHSQGTPPAPAGPAAVVADPGVPVLAPTEARIEEATAEAEATSAVEPRWTIEVPQVVVTSTPRTFELSAVPDLPFEQIGRQLAEAGFGDLDRKVLDVEPDPKSPTGYRLVPRTATDLIQAAEPQLPMSGATSALVDAVYGLDVVPQTRANLNAAKRLAAAAAAAGGGEERLGSYLNAARQLARRIVIDAYRSVPENQVRTVGTVDLGRPRINSRPVETNRYGKFARSSAYGGWAKSQYEIEWFDSAPERDLANLLDDSGEVERWSRLQRGDLVIPWSGGRYSPDFYAAVDGVHHLLEVKADKDTSSSDVVAKASAAAEWARFVTDHGDHGTWRYLLVPEGAIATGKTLRAVLNLSATS